MSMSNTLASPWKRSRNEAMELIEQVRQRACLWDRACATYRNRLHKEQAWQDICRALQPDYADMTPGERHEIGLVTMRKWYNIRDAYKKYYTSKGNAAHSSRPYVYADLLTFLIPIFEGKTKPDPIKYELIDDGGHDHDREEWLSVFELDQSEATPPKRGRPDPENPRTKPQTEADDSVLSLLVNLIEKEEDEDRAFFRSITPAVKSLPDEVKFVFRIQVMKLLNNLKKELKDKEERTLRIPEESDSD